MKRIISWFLILVLCVGVGLSTTGCGSAGKSANKGDIDATFPLEEPVTFTLMVIGTEDSAFKSNMENNALWKKLEEETNVHIEFQFLGTDPSEKLTLLINGGGYGDAIVGGPVLNYISASRYIASGIFQDLTDYVNEDTMPNLTEKINANPAIVGMISGADGNIYTLPVLNNYPGNSIESPIWINKAWLDKCGLDVPETLDEFTAALRAFRDKDPNGNGIQDEIPYLVSTAREYFSLEALYGCWGMAFKSGTLDGYLQVVDGNVRFGPILDEYKEAVKYQAMLYDEGLMWNECFTASSQTGYSKLSSETCVVGCFTANTVVDYTEYEDDYVCIAPPKVEGYEQVWYNNPSTIASKDRFYVTDKCEYPEILLKWFDYFYNFDYAFEVVYGGETDGRWYTDESGVRVIKDDLTSDEVVKIDKETPTLLDLIEKFPHALTRDDYTNKMYDVTLDDQLTAYNVYKDYANDEIWPRPYLTTEDANKVYKLTTDIFYQVSTYRANWITGKGDIDKEWDEYVKKLEGMGVNDMVAAMQRAYDAYLVNLDNATK